MSRVAIAGRSAIITSAYTAEELEMVERFAPEKLRLRDTENKTELFRIGFDKNNEDFSQYGITFGQANEDGYAYTALLFPQNVDEKSRATIFLEDHAKTLASLNLVEAQIAQAMEDIATMKNAVASTITTVQ